MLSRKVVAFWSPTESKSTVRLTNLQKSVDGGRVRLSIGFNFGRNVGDSVLGEVIGQDEDGVSGVRSSLRATPDGVSTIAMSELRRDLASLT